MFLFCDYSILDQYRIIIYVTGFLENQSHTTMQIFMTIKGCNLHRRSVPNKFGEIFQQMHNFLNGKAVNIKILIVSCMKFQSQPSYTYM